MGLNSSSGSSTTTTETVVQEFNAKSITVVQPQITLKFVSITGSLPSVMIKMLSSWIPNAMDLVYNFFKYILYDKL